MNQFNDHHPRQPAEWDSVLQAPGSLLCGVDASLHFRDMFLLARPVEARPGFGQSHPQ
jgi:hypothetical protein